MAPSIIHHHTLLCIESPVAFRPAATRLLRRRDNRSSNGHIYGHHDRKEFFSSGLGLVFVGLTPQQEERRGFSHLYFP